MKTTKQPKTGTDAHIVALARKMQRLQDKLSDLLHQVSQSGHPNAEALHQALADECWFAASPVHVVASDLSAPERWETGDFGIRKIKRQPGGRTRRHR